ncbi:MAG: zinc ribbon-containing protein [Pseudomonadota bacterium]
MKDLLPPHDPVEAMGEAYELLLEKALQKAHQSSAVVHDMMEVVRRDIVALNKFDDEEIVKLEHYVKRDLINAAWYLDTTGKALKDWLGFDVALIKNEFWARFSEAADQTTVALSQLKLLAANAEYHSGELIGLGTLVCDQCGQKLHFHKPGHIPPCPKCTSTHFHRQNFE